MKTFDETTFYDLMQSYRHASLEEQGAVTAAYENVKLFVAELVLEFNSGKFDEHQSYLDWRNYSKTENAGLPGEWIEAQRAMFKRMNGIGHSKGRS